MRKGAKVMKDLAYYNGVYTPYDAACIPLSDRSIFFSDAVYDVIIGSGKKPYQLDEHIERLLSNAKRIGLVNLPTKSEIFDVVENLLSDADRDDFLLYIQLSANNERRNHARDDSEVNLLITVTGCELPRELATIKAITLPDMRHSFCNLKTTSLLPAILSVEESQRRGADIAVFHKNQNVTECSYANISLMKNGTLITHPLDTDILPGITQENLIGICKKVGIPHISRNFTLDELYDADAVMITSTTKLIKICTEVDGRQLTPKNLDTIKTLFDELKGDLYNKIDKKCAN